MTIFKEFLDAVKADQRRRDLFLFAKKREIDEALVGMFNYAEGLRLYPIVRRSSMSIVIGNSYAKLRTAYPGMGTELAGMPWSAVHGLDTLDRFEEGEADKERLRAWIRPNIVSGGNHT